MRYIYSNNEGVDTMEVETDGKRVTNVVTIVPAADGSPDMTAEQLQDDLDLYMGHPGSSIESALANWAGGYSTFRKVEE